MIPRYSWRIYQQIIDGSDLETVKNLYDLYGKKYEKIEETVEKIIDKYRPCYIDTDNPEYTVDDFREAFIHHCKETPSENIKLDEWNALKDPGPQPKEGDYFEFCPEKIDISSKPLLKKYFDKLIIVKRLTEILALYGFTRITPPENKMKHSFEEKQEPAISDVRERDDAKWQMILNNMTDGDGATRRGYLGLTEIDSQTKKPKPKDKRDWLPGVKNRGEGIFFVFNKQRLERWENNDYWNIWTKKIVDNGVKTLSIMQGFEFTSRGLLLHSFSHLLAKQIATECGYQLASLRERIYCSRADNMYGVLIYTSTPDSQGSLGGLVSQAADLDVLTEHIQSVIESSRICSQDPLCGLNNPEITKKPWGAACHACAHIPETSCECLMNRFLDRHTIYGDNLNKKGYFA